MAANVLDNLANWSTSDASNQPEGSDAADIDAELRRIQSVVRKYTRTIGANIASASTVDLSTATGDVITVTGTTTITGLGTVSAGMRFWLVFSGALTLTHNGTSLILPGAANITTVAGDVACFESLGSGNWRCLVYTKNTAPIVYALPGANSDITSLSGLTTPLSIAQGGTGAASLTAGTYLKGNGTSAVATQSGLPAHDITSGTVGTARLGSGTASGSTFLRGDQTWATLTTSQVLAATADASAGAVGTYAFMKHQSSGTSVENGNTVAGSSLRFTGVSSGTTGSGSFIDGSNQSSTTPSGTWRQMGFNESRLHAVSLYLRIS